MQTLKITEKEHKSLKNQLSKAQNSNIETMQTQIKTLDEHINKFQAMNKDLSKFNINAKRGINIQIDLGDYVDRR